MSQTDKFNNKKIVSLLMIRFAIIETLPAAVDLMFEIVSLRYEQGAVIITSKWTYKDWPEMFNNEDTLSL